MAVLIPQLDSISATFVASLRSVGTAVTLAAVGLYLHHTGAIGAEGKRTLALLSQQVTFPLFLFTKIIYCNQDWSDKPCPDVTRSLADVWMLLWWPAYVVGVGLLIGWVVAKICGTPKHQIRSVLAACAFGNSTGLPITLLKVIHQNVPIESDLGRIDPTLFLSVFLLLYPVLQWGLGGWLLTPETDDETTIALTTIDVNDHGNTKNKSTSRDNSLLSSGHKQASARSISTSVLNNTELKSYYQKHRHGLSSADEGLYMTELDFPRLLQEAEEREQNSMDVSVDSDSPNSPSRGSWDTRASGNGVGHDHTRNPTEGMPLLAGSLTTTSIQQPPPQASNVTTTIQSFDAGSIWQTLRNILERCLQPPVIGAVAGMLVAVIPGMRGIFVDLVDRDNSAPLQFLFDGLYAVGETAVPINMMILGCNLSSSVSQKSKDLDDRTSAMLPMSSMIGIVVGKMVITPIIGILSAVFLKTYVWDIPEDIDGAFYLVLMIVFLTPTANNVIIMVELSGSDAKEGMARVIALQYLVAPLILSATMTIAIGVASGWSQ